MTTLLLNCHHATYNSINIHFMPLYHVDVLTQGNLVSFVFFLVYVEFG